MSYFNLKYTDVSRYQIEYPLKQLGRKNLHVLSDTKMEASHQNIILENTDTVSFAFEKSFSDTPTVIAGFVGNSNVSVYVESVTKSGGVIRTSSPVDFGEVAIHAIYLGS